MSTLGPGDRIERYVIEAPLGEGGMGRVYRAHDERLDRRVALKVLITDSATGTEGRARLLREARAAATLDHPNVVQVYDVGEADGSPFIAMELVLGRSLRPMINDMSVTLSDRMHALAGVASALAAAHDAGIVHRDVKPENVIVRPDGRVKVLDFGIARKSRESTDPSAPTAGNLATLTAEGIKVGTPMYMAPEQIRGGSIDGRSDQFAWGVTAYELLTGRTPWTSPDAMALMASILTEEPAPFPPSTPIHIANVVMRTLSKKPEGRYASMREVLVALGATEEPTSFQPRFSAPRHADSAPPTTSAASGDAPLRSDNAQRPPAASAPPPPSYAHPFSAGPQPFALPVATPMLSRRYSPKELEEILDRALRMQPTGLDNGYRYEEIAAAAREVGVDEPTLEAAMRDMVKRGAVEPPETDRLRSRNRFNRHLGVWGAFAAFFFLINFSDNVFGNGHEWWFEFPMISWGVLLAVHFVFYRFPTPKAPRPLARRSADPRIDYDARTVSTLLATRIPRARIASPVARPRAAAAERAEPVVDQAMLEAEAEVEAELEAGRAVRRVR